MKILKKSIFSKAGFSLMELVITVTIIIILSAISGPIYKSFSSKAHLAEAYALLGTLRSAQENYFNDKNTYLFGNNCSSGSWLIPTCNDEILGVDARPNKYYTAFLGGIYNKDIPFSPYNRGFICVAKGKTDITLVYNRTSGVTVY